MANFSIGRLFPATFNFRDGTLCIKSWKKGDIRDVNNHNKKILDREISFNVILAFFDIVEEIEISSTDSQGDITQV